MAHLAEGDGACRGAGARAPGGAVVCVAGLRGALATCRFSTPSSLTISVASCGHRSAVAARKAPTHIILGNHRGCTSWNARRQARRASAPSFSLGNSVERSGMPCTQRADSLCDISFLPPLFFYRPSHKVW